MATFLDLFITKIVGAMFNSWHLIDYSMQLYFIANSLVHSAYMGFLHITLWYVEL